MNSFDYKFLTALIYEDDFKSFNSGVICVFITMSVLYFYTIHFFKYKND